MCDMKRYEAKCKSNAGSEEKRRGCCGLWIVKIRHFSVERMRHMAWVRKDCRLSSYDRISREMATENVY